MEASKNFTMKKNKLKSNERHKDNTGNEKEKKKGMKLSRLRKKRLIIRNLSFKVDEKQLKDIFSKFGEILDVKIPVKSDGKKRGFAFVQFDDTKSMIKAMKKLNFQKINGRPIAIDFAVNKDTYLSRQKSSLNSDSKNNILKEEIKLEDNTDDSDDESISDLKRNSLEQEIKLEENTDDSDDESITDLKTNRLEQEIKSDIETDDSDDESDTYRCKPKKKSVNIADKNNDDSKVKEFLKEFDMDEEELPENSESEESSEDEEQESNSLNEQDDHNESYNSENKTYRRKQSEDISEGKTVFIRNISFKSNADDLQEILEEFGETVYCLFCNDPITGHFRGTAFVKFKERENAEKLIEESSKEPGILLDGRKLLCSNAVSREELSNKKDGSEKNRDKRNLRLLKCGLVAYGYKEAEGVSQTDMAKRAQLEALKKKKLRNVNFFVSDKRLMCHNIPKNVNDKDLYHLFKKAGGKGAVINEARIMKDFKKTDVQGNPVSRGFAFIAFSEHEHALNALNELNNNPNIFTANKRPIVEFSVENTVALLSQKRRREKFQNKKRMEQSNNRNSQATSDQQSSETVVTKFKKQRFQKKRKQHNIKSKSDETTHFQQKRKQSNSNSPSIETISEKKKKKQKKGKGKQKQNVQGKMEISALTQMYKKKLLNKVA